MGEAGSVEAYREHYAAMQEADLETVIADVGNLVPNARTALRDEMESRGLLVDGVDWAIQLPPEPKGRPTWRLMLLWVAFLFACNFLFRSSGLFILRCASAIELLLTPAEIIASIIVLVFLSKRNRRAKSVA